MAKELAIKGGPKAVPDEVVRQWPYILPEDKQAVLRAMDYGLRSDDTPQIDALEREWAAYVGAEHCLATNSGTAALHLCVAGAGIGPGDEVLVPAYTFVASGTAVLHNNAIPVFVDVEPETWNIDPRKIRQAITPHTRAIMPVHLNGYPADVDEIRAIAEEHDLAVIEDACQAHGARYKGRKTGTLGDAAAFSLNSYKNLPGGDGGLFVTSDTDCYRRAAMVREFGERTYEGSKRQYRSYALGCMYRTTDLVAALVRSQLKRLDEMNARRIDNAMRIRQGLGGYDFLSFPPYRDDRTCVYWFFPMRLSAQAAGFDLPDSVFRDRVMAALNAEGLRVTQWQTVTLPAQSVFHDKIGYGKGSPWSDRNYRGNVTYEPERFPAAQSVVDSTLWLVNLYHWPHTLQDQDTYTIPAFEKVFSRLEDLVHPSEGQ